jgi:pentatricopeptide repeat protein
LAVALHGLFQAGRTASAKELYMRMVDSGIQLDVDTCTIFFGGLCDNGCLDEAMRMFQDLLSKNIQLDIASFTTMIDALFKSGRKKDAWICFLLSQPMLCCQML